MICKKCGRTHLPAYGGYHESDSVYIRRRYCPLCGRRFVCRESIIFVSGRKGVARKPTKHLRRVARKR